LTFLRDNAIIQKELRLNTVKSGNFISQEVYFKLLEMDILSYNIEFWYFDVENRTMND